MPAPIGHTCPDINKCIKLLNSIVKTAEFGMKDLEKGTDLYNQLSEIIDEAQSVDSILEDLRHSNDELRSWGNEQEKEINSLNNYISELENSLEEQVNKMIC
jgi:peptidoglycan hydrolase CwlO-like protein